MGSAATKMNYEAGERARRRENTYVVRVRGRRESQRKPVSTWPRHSRAEPINITTTPVVVNKFSTLPAKSHALSGNHHKRKLRNKIQTINNNKGDTGNTVKLRERWVVSDCGKNLGEIGRPTDVTLLTNGIVAVCEETNKRIQFFDKTGQSVRFLNQTHHKEIQSPTCLCEDPNNSTLLVADPDVVHILDHTGRRTGVCSLDTNYIRSMCFMSHDQHLVVSDEGSWTAGQSASPTVALFTLEGKLVSEMMAEFKNPHFVACDNDLHMVAVSDSYTGSNKVTVFDTRARDPINVFTHGAAEAEFLSPGGVAFRPNRALLVTDRARSVVHELDMRSKKWVACLSEMDGIRAPMCLDTGPNGRLVLSEERLEEIEIYTVKLFTLDATNKPSHTKKATRRRSIIMQSIEEVTIEETHL